MPKFVIEREIPGVGDMSDAQICDASKTSCRALREVGPQVQWVHSYVTRDKIYCVYIAPSEHEIRAHAEHAGVPANRISAVERIIDPTTAEG